MGLHLWHRVVILRFWPRRHYSNGATLVINRLYTSYIDLDPVSDGQMETRLDRCMAAVWSRRTQLYGRDGGWSARRGLQPGYETVTS